MPGGEANSRRLASSQLQQEQTVLNGDRKGAGADWSWCPARARRTHPAGRVPTERDDVYTTLCLPVRALHGPNLARPFADVPERTLVVFTADDDAQAMQFATGGGCHQSIERLKLRKVPEEPMFRPTPGSKCSFPNGPGNKRSIDELPVAALKRGDSSSLV